MIDTSASKKQNAIVAALGAIALVLLVVIYFVPAWWVSLTAPQYPKTAFPDGIRIHFHMNGVFNGCPKVQKKEIEEDVVLDCVHEMDAINHFVGMYPTGAGGVVEKAYSPFLLIFLGLLIIGFIIPQPKLRFGVMMAGWAVMVGWMYMTMMTQGGIKYQPASYIKSLVTALGEGKEEAGEELSPIIAKLQKSLEASGDSSLVKTEEVRSNLEKSGQKKLSDIISNLNKGGTGPVKTLKQILAEAKASGADEKTSNIEILHQAFLTTQSRLPENKRQKWTGSGMQVLLWHYHQTLARWFNNPARINPLVRKMTIAAKAVFWGLIVVPPVLFFLASFGPAFFYWLLGLIPAILPVAFVIEYASWLYWFGHSMSSMGAFSLKPFMPTVFGQGKVAQFATHSYPHIGFGLMVALSIIMLLAVLIRRKQLKTAAAGA